MTFLEWLQSRNSDMPIIYAGLISSVLMFLGGMFVLCRIQLATTVIFAILILIRNNLDV